ncbi:MAG: ATP-binding protein [Pseudomonadota bacterium]
MHGGAQAALAVAGTALAYAGCAALFLMLVPAGSFASPVFPSAGVALACVLRFGPVAAIGVVLGAFVSNAAFISGEDDGKLLLFLAFAAGAGLQSLLGAHLVRRWLGPWPGLTQGAHILRFYAVGAGLACLVSASVATGSLAWLGRFGHLDTQWMGFDALAVNWWTWYSGDALGVLVGAPVTLALVGRPAQVWRPRCFTVALPLVLALGLVTWASARMAEHRAEQAAAALERDVGAAVESITAKLQRNVDALTALHGAFIGSTEVTRAEFERIAAPWLASLPSIQAMGFSELIDPRDTTRMARIEQADGRSSFRVFDRDQRLTAGDDRALAIRFIEPFGRNARALGVNALSVAEARRAILGAFESDHPVATTPFQLTQESAGQRGVVIYQAIRLPGGEPLGVVFTTLRLDDALASVTKGLPTSLMYCLQDVTGEPLALAGPAPCLAAGGPTRGTTLELGARRWALRVMPAPGPSLYDAARGDTAVWLFSLGGLLSVATLGAFLLLLTGRAGEARAEAALRTQQLQRTQQDEQLTRAVLRSTEERFKLLFDKVPVGVVFADLDGRILQPNAWCCEFLGYAEEALRGKTLRELTPADEVDDEQRRRQTLKKQGAGQLRYVRRYIRSDGQLVHGRVTLTLLLDAAGQPDRFVGLIEDLSDHVRWEEAESARAAAESANRAKTQFLSRMSHELRTPLNAILGFAQLLSLDEALGHNEKHRQWLTQMQGAGWHLLRLIDDVLDLSRIEAGTVSLKMTAVDAQAVLLDAVSMVEGDARQRGVAIVRPEPAAAGSLQAWADATRLRQVLINLLSNAVKYNRPGGEVRLRLTVPEAGSIVVEVRDTGLGMSPEQLARLFTPFDRLGRENTAVAGAGIGLYITKLLVEQMQGRIEVSSRPEAGSAFRIRLRRAAVDAGHGDGDGPATEPGSLYSERSVVLVEDNEDNIGVVRGLLALRPQVTLRVAHTGREGVKVVQATQPDLVLLDLRLPDGDGESVLKALKSSGATRDIPVVVLSASADDEQVARVLALGAAGFVPKPIEAAVLLSVLDRQLGQVTTGFGDLG